MNTTELDFEVIESNRDLFRKLLKGETKKNLAKKCRSLKYFCPVADDIFECPFTIPCSEVDRENWNDVDHIINSYD